MLDDNIVKRVANTSRINIDENDLSSLKKDFEDILEIFHVIDSANVDDDFKIHSIDVSCEFREDIESDTKTKKEYKKPLMELSPHSKENFFKGPRCFE